MFRKSRKAEQTIEPQKEVKARKSRFQIVKLEERIAPRGGCGYGGGSCGGYHSSCHYNPHGKLVGNC
jgi:hypothetical protein